jgi:hypothetical protein
MRLHQFLIVTLALSLPLCAQTTKKTDGKAAQKKTEAVPAAKAVDSAPPTMKPSPEINKIATTFVGRWKVSGKILDEQWAPGGAQGSGFETIRRGPGGFSLVSDTKMDFGKMGPFSGHGVMFWDAAKNAYSGVWCDSWGPTCEPMGLAKWEGEKLVINGEMQAGPQKVPMRQTYSNISKDGYDWLLEAGDGKGGWKQEMALKYQRSEGSGLGAPSGLTVQPH